MDNVEMLMELERLVYSIIKKYEAYYDKDDLYQAGMMGLIQAQRHFDSSSGAKFSTYAYNYIIGEVTKFVSEDKSVVVSRDTMRLKKEIDKTRDILRQRLYREPTALEISLVLEIEEEKVYEVERQTQAVRSLDYVTDDDSVDLYNSVGFVDTRTQSDIMDLREQVASLPVEEKHLIYSRYYRDLTQSETSKELGMSQVQVSRKESQVLQKLKTRL